MTATTQTEALNAARANYYRFLRRFYFQEVDTPLWAQLRQMNIPADCPQPRMAEGYEMLRDFLARHDADILDELAADFAKVFLASGEYQGKGAFPYESVYTSRQGLVRQQAWEQVRGIYDAAGLTLTGAPSEIMEDHIATELEYMALLAEQGTAAPAQQLDFLTQHLLNWVPRLCADMKKYARTDFYKAVALLTEGFLAMDAELLEERSQGSTGSFQLTHVQMNAVLAELSKTYRIFAPKRTGKRGPGGQAYAHVVRAFQARRGQPVEQGAEAGGHGLRRQIGAGDVVQIRNFAAFQPDAAQCAREFSPGLEDDEAVLGDHNALRSGLHVKGGTSEGIPDAYPDFAFVFEGLERPFRHEFLPYLFKRDAQGGLHVHAAGGEIARNEGDLPLDGACKHGTPHGELMQGQPILFPAGFHCAFQLVQAGTLEHGQAEIRHASAHGEVQ